MIKAVFASAAAAAVMGSSAADALKLFGAMEGKGAQAVK